MSKKRKLILISVLSILIIALSFGLFLIIKQVQRKENINYVENIISSYNEDETLSFENFLQNTFQSEVNCDDESFNFNYKNLNFTISNQKITKVEKIASNREKYNAVFDSFFSLENSNVVAGQKVYVKSYYKNLNKGCAIYEISQQQGQISFELKNGLYANMIVKNKTISPCNFGAYADGKNDDSNAISLAFKFADGQNVKNIMFDKGNYLCNDYLCISNKTNISLLGNDSTLIVTDEFKNNEKYEFFFSIRDCENILISHLNIDYQFLSAKYGIRTQFQILTSKNIEVFSCKFLIDHSLRDETSSGYTNFDAYSGWQNVIINNCTFLNLCDNEAGGGIWIRDLYNQGSSNLKLLNSNFRKIAHDEILAVFMGQISDVLIKNNSFIVEDDGLSSSVMNFTFGSSSSTKAENITFEKNTVDTCATGGLAWVKCVTNCVIKDNDIKIRLSSKANGNNQNGNFRAFEGQSVNNKLIQIESIENNKIELFSNLESYLFQYTIFGQVNNICGNTIISHCPITTAFISCNNVKNNNFESYDTVQHFVYNVYSFKENTAKFNELVSCAFRYYGFSLIKNVEILSNKIDYMKEEPDDYKSHIMMLNNSSYNNFYINFVGNTIFATKANSTSRIIMSDANDEENQTINFYSNNIVGFKNNYYLKKTIINENKID